MDSANWLVKSSGRILGPFTQAELSAKLKTRELSIHDEAAVPQAFWRPLCDEKKFEKIVNEVRQEVNSDTSITKTFSDEMTLTDEYHPISDDLTGEIDTKNLELTKEIIIENLKDETQIPPETTPQPVKSFGYQASDVASAGAQMLNKKMWLTVGTVAVLLLVLVLIQTLIIKPKSDHEKYDEYVSLGKDAIHLGLYKEALDNLSAAYEINSEGKDIYIFLAPLLVHLTSQSFLAEELLHSVESDGEPKIKKRAITALGTLGYKDGNKSLATIFYKKALDIDPNYTPALVNLGLLQSLRSNYRKSSKSFKRALKIDDEPEMIRFYYALSLVAQLKGEIVLNKLLQAQKHLRWVAKKGAFLAQESKLMLIYLSVLTNPKKYADKEVTSLLDMDPEQSNNHRYNLFINQNWVQWSSLVEYCNAIKLSVKKEHLKTTLDAFCSIKALKRDKASKLADKLAHQAPKDALAQAVVGYIKDNLNLESEARIAVKGAVKNNSKHKFSLPMILQARFCMREQNYECTLRESTLVLKNKPRNLMALSMLATTHFHDGEFDKAGQLLRDGLRVSTEYSPLLMLKKQMQEAE